MYLHEKKLNIQAKATYTCQRDHVRMPKILLICFGLFAK